ncbi:hypothetical protein BBJ28_00017246 [Nothophytophthora sp. Chile5]|nr:hypothetical protein BBJ28_00017246 [Nothophytophthora sp. Chile5]
MSNMATADCPMETAATCETPSRPRAPKPAAPTSVGPVLVPARPPRRQRQSLLSSQLSSEIPTVRVALTEAARVPAQKRRVKRMQSAKKRKVDEARPSNASLRLLSTQDEASSTARQRFVPDSEDEDVSPSPPMFTSAQRLPPKLVTSTSEGRANALPSRRRQLPPHFQSAWSPATAAAPPPPPPPAWSDPTRGAFLSRDKLVRKYFGGAPEHNHSFESLSSASSNSSVLPLNHRPGTAAATVAAALERGLMSSSTYSQSSFLTDDMLLAIARRAKKQLEAVAKRQVMVGRWKRMPRSKPDCQMFESVSKAKDQYSVVAKINLPCSLREIMSVFSTDNAAEFHRSMEALFGDQYVYGVNVRSVECPAFPGGGSAALRSRARRCSEPAAWRASQAAAAGPLHAAKLKLNAVSLMQKHRMVWKQRNMTFLDYLEENLEAKSVTRVMQTMDVTEDNMDCDSVGSLPSPTAASSSLESCYQQQQQQNQHGIPPRHELKGILAGYVVQEDSEEKFTRFFFYATHHHQPTGPHAQSKIPRSVVQLLRAMVSKVCLLESVVLRRRLGYYPLSRMPTSPDASSGTAYCAACYIPFSMLRKKYFCRLCGHYTCRKCSSLQDVEKTVGLVERHRVCATCVRQVGYCVFSMSAFPPQSMSAANGSKRMPVGTQSAHEIPEEPDEDQDSPPILDDLAATDIEDVAIFNPSEGGEALADFMAELLHATEKKQEQAKERKNRLQLSIEDLSSWGPGHPIVDGQNTPKESISLLDSFCTSQSSSGSRTRDLPAWLSPSPTGG